MSQKMVRQEQKWPKKKGAYFCYNIEVLIGHYDCHFNDAIFGKVQPSHFQIHPYEIVGSALGHLRKAGVTLCAKARLKTRPYLSW